MKLDTHVHTTYSGRSTIRPLDRLMRESYNTPEAVYARAKARGMDLVTITDHDRIDGVLTIADRPDVIIGCEVTAIFPRDGVRVHLGVLGLTEAQHREIEYLRHDVSSLLPYLKAERIFVSLNHLASRVNGRVTAAHLAALLPWVDGLEIINGSRLRLQNETARRVASANGKIGIAGSDSHTERGIGLTWIEAPDARTREEFLVDLHAGRIRAGGKQGSAFTMASDVIRMTSDIYVEHGRAFLERPWRWRRQLMMVCLALGCPLVSVPLVLSVLHFVLEARFNQTLLEDIVKRPGLLPEAA